MVVVVVRSVSLGRLQEQAPAVHRQLVAVVGCALCTP
jgi:hypothetical protein